MERTKERVDTQSDTSMDIIRRDEYNDDHLEKKHPGLVPVIPLAPTRYHTDEHMNTQHWAFMCRLV